MSGAVATGSAATITLSGTGSLGASASIVTVLPTTLVLAGGSVASAVTGAASLLVSVTANSTLGSFTSISSNRVKLTSAGNFTIDVHAGDNQFVFSGGARLSVGGSTPIISAAAGQAGAGVNLLFTR